VKIVVVQNQYIGMGRKNNMKIVKCDNNKCEYSKNGICTLEELELLTTEDNDYIYVMCTSFSEGADGN